MTESSGGIFAIRQSRHQETTYDGDNIQLKNKKKFNYVFDALTRETFHAEESMVFITENGKTV